MDIGKVDLRHVTVVKGDTESCIAFFDMKDMGMAALDFGEEYFVYNHVAPEFMEEDLMQ